MAPDFVTHYHRADRAPFLNLSDLTETEARAVTTDLAQAGGSERRFGPRYHQLRRDTERLLRERFIARGGQPQRRSPHYFVLGESGWFRGMYRDYGQVRLDLAALPPEATSLTWPDSIASMGLLVEYGISLPDKPQYGQVFQLDELDRVLAAFGRPDSGQPADYTGHQRAAFDHFIEVQLWSDEPIADWL